MKHSAGCVGMKGRENMISIIMPVYNVEKYVDRAIPLCAGADLSGLRIASDR